MEAPQFGQVDVPPPWSCLSKLFESLRVTDLSQHAWDFPGLSPESPVYREAPSAPGVGHPGSFLSWAKVLVDSERLLVLELGSSILIPRCSPHKYGSEEAKIPISFLGSQTVSK